MKPVKEKKTHNENNKNKNLSLHPKHTYIHTIIDKRTNIKNFNKDAKPEKKNKILAAFQTEHIMVTTKNFFCQRYLRK